MKFTRHYKHYESEFSEFLNGLKQQHPEIEKDQREGFAIWWDKPPLELDAMKRDKMSEVKPKAYLYD